MRISSICGLLVSFSICSISRADLILDQSHEPAPVETFGIIQTADKSQTFTVGIAGQLDQVDIEVERRSSTISPLLLDIRTTIGGVPTEADSGPTVLAQVSLDASLIPIDDYAFISVDLSGFDIPVAINQTLAITLRTDASNFLAYSWHGTNGSGSEYSGGSGFNRTTGTWGADGLVTDFGFRTHVTATSVPEPSSILFGAFSLCGLGIASWRRKTRRRASAPLGHRI